MDLGKNYNETDSENKRDSLGYDLDWEKQRVAEATEEIKKELLEKWQKRYAGAEIFPSAVSNINPAVINFLLSYKNTIFYNDLAKKFNLNSEQRDALPQTIWKISADKSWDQMESIIRNKFNLDSNTTTNIINLLNQNIITELKKLSLGSYNSSGDFRRQVEKKEVKTVRLSLSQALKEYPKLESQQVTNDFLKLRYSEFPSRPTIKNWITDYYQNLGVGGHGIMERGNFLFHSDNCKKLTSAERQKLALVFKSLSENMPLVIDAEKQQIIFPEMNSEERSIINKEQEAISNAQNVERGTHNVEQTGQKSDFSHPTSILPSGRGGGNSGKGEVRFFSGQEMKPSPQISSMEQVASSKQQTENINTDNLRFSSPQKLSAEKEKQDTGNSTLKIYPREYRNGSENNDNSKMQDVKVSGNVVDLKNKN